ncbi:MAG: UDP-N-acetylmuramate dehydrogenase [Candidatus Riflebacteria bacterium]|nr:UDP-N-acetylmuramate dehydrogenase [Candidatus Riflebacteria bacterium]
MNPLAGLETLVPHCIFGAPAASCTTFRVGGPAWALCEVQTVGEFRALSTFAIERHCPVRIVGKGSNLLFGDDGFPGVLVTLGHDFQRITIGQEGLFTAGAGVSLAKLANTLARAGLGGFEFVAQIPGCVGGSVAVNAGAFGQDLHSRLLSVRALDLRGLEVELAAAALAGCYRTTALKGHQDLSLIEATFQAVPMDPEVVLKKQGEYGEYRRRTQPINQASAGCVFKNPGKGCSAGALIDKLGLKGLAVGDARVSDKHANFIVNLGKARARDIVDLIGTVRGRVYTETGILLEPELELVGVTLPA